MTALAADALRRTVLAAFLAALALYVVFGPETATWWLGGAAVGLELLIRLFRGVDL